MYLVFVGTTDYLKNLKEFLKNVNHTLLEGTSTWEGSQLKAQIIICFSRTDAKIIQRYCLDCLHQKEVPIKRLLSI